jgi:nuclear GTP-binding protein
MREQPSGPSRIEPDPKWFGNVRTIGQKDLEKLRVEMKESVEDSYTVLLNKRKLPMSLIEEDESAAKIKILDYEKYEVSCPSLWVDSN